MRFWDSSALGSLLLDEAHSTRARPLLQEDSSLMVWWGTLAECYSVIWSASRRGRIPVDSASRAESRLEDLRRGWIEIEPTAMLRELAIRIIRVHELRAADALQLAAALMAHQQEGAPMEFVCFDRRLAAAAVREGLPIISNQDNPL